MHGELGTAPSPPCAELPLYSAQNLTTRLRPSLAPLTLPCTSPLHLCFPPHRCHTCVRASWALLRPTALTLPCSPSCKPVASRQCCSHNLHVCGSTHAAAGVGVRLDVKEWGPKGTGAPGEARESVQVVSWGGGPTRLKLWGPTWHGLRHFIVAWLAQRSQRHAGRHGCVRACAAH